MGCAIFWPSLLIIITLPYCTRCIMERMLLSNKKDYNIKMQVADSVRYREAVTRLKRILYDQPSSLERSRSKSPLRERKSFPETFHNKEEYEKEFSDKAIDDNQKSFSSLFEMVRRQEDLIAQLEKENLFLKTELVSTAEASKEIALQNESFRKRLTDTLIQMETGPDISSCSDGNEKTDEIISCLKEERERLIECIKLQEETIGALRERETEAIDKVKQAVGLAEDSQRLTDKVRESGEQNRKDLQYQLEDALDKTQVLQAQLQRAHEKEREQEMIFRDQENSLSKLEEDRRDKDLSIRKRELDYKNQVEDLKRNLKEAEEGKQRLEKLLQEQKNTSEATFKRLEALLDRRNIEAEAFANRRKSLEKQVLELNQENQRLIQAINDLAKERSSHTDDAKYAKQMSDLIPDDMNAKEEIKEIKATVQQHQDSISHLQEEVTAVRQEMTQGIEGLRANIEELCSTVNNEDIDSNINSRKKPTDSNDETNVKCDPHVDPIPNSFRSEGYESMKELSTQSVTPNAAKGEKSYIGKVEDKATKVISIPFSHKIRSNGMPKKVEVDLEKKEVDETEDDVTLSYDNDDSKKVTCSEEIKVDETSKQRAIVKDPLDNNDNTGLESDSLENRSEPKITKDNDIENNFNDQNVLEVSQKENKISAAEDENDRDECTADVSQSDHNTHCESQENLSALDSNKDDIKEKDTDGSNENLDRVNQTLPTTKTDEINNEDEVNLKNGGNNLSSQDAENLGQKSIKETLGGREEIVEGTESDVSNKQHSDNDLKKNEGTANLRNKDNLSSHTAENLEQESSEKTSGGQEVVEKTEPDVDNEQNFDNDLKNNEGTVNVRDKDSNLSTDITENLEQESPEKTSGVQEVLDKTEPVVDNGQNAENDLKNNEDTVNKGNEDNLSSHTTENLEQKSSKKTSEEQEETVEKTKPDVDNEQNSDNDLKNDEDTVTERSEDNLSSHNTENLEQKSSKKTLSEQEETVEKTEPDVDNEQNSDNDLKNDEDTVTERSEDNLSSHNTENLEQKSSKKTLSEKEETVEKTEPDVDNEQNSDNNLKEVKQFAEVEHNNGESHVNDSNNLNENLEEGEHGEIVEGTLPLEAVVEIVGEEIHEIKEAVELQSKRIDNITNKILALPDMTKPDNDSPPAEECSKSKDTEKDDDGPVE